MVKSLLKFWYFVFYRYFILGKGGFWYVCTCTYINHIGCMVPLWFNRLFLQLLCNFYPELQLAISSHVYKRGNMARDRDRKVSSSLGALRVRERKRSLWSIYWIRSRFNFIFNPICRNKINLTLLLSNFLPSKRKVW